MHFNITIKATSLAIFSLCTEEAENIGRWFHPLFLNLLYTKLFSQVTRNCWVFMLPASRENAFDMHRCWVIRMWSTTSGPRKINMVLKRCPWLTDWLTDWLTRLADRLTYWLTGWLAGWLTDWLTDLLTIWLAYWLTYWLADWLADLLTDRLADLLTDWLTDWLTDRLTGC